MLLPKNVKLTPSDTLGHFLACNSIASLSPSFIVCDLEMPSTLANSQRYVKISSRCSTSTHYFTKLVPKNLLYVMICFPPLSCLPFNQCMRDNIRKTNGASQLLHLFTIMSIPIIYNKKCPWERLVVRGSPKLCFLSWLNSLSLDLLS